jgi:stage V sporulation protein G
MKITKVKVTKFEDERVKALASITIDDCFIVKDIRIIQGNDRLFVSMPSKKTGDGSFMDICHPLNNECRQMIEEAILSEYNGE